MDTKFAKASILGKPPLQPSRNHLVVKQPNAFTSKRPRISRPRFASKVDEKNDLSKIVTPHYLPKVKESASAKPNHVNAPSSSRNSKKESYGSNDMAHTYFLEEGRKKTHDKTRIPNHRDMASARAHCTPNDCLRWIPTGKMFTNSTTNVDSEPLSGSNDDIANPYECDQTLYFSACTFNSSAGLVLHQMTLDHSSSSLGPHCLMTFEQNSSGLVLHQMTFEQIGSSLAPFLKEKKGVRFSALYLQKKRNLLVFDHSHQQRLHILDGDTMAEENIPAPEPTRRDEQILHCSEWLQIGKGNLLLDLQKLQKNPIFRISVDIRQNTNFVRAFTTSTNVPSIYIQLFWNTLTHDAKTGVYSFQVDKHWLTLSVDLLRKALDVTPADSAHPFESPPAGKTGMYFVNELGYPEPIHFVSKIHRWIIASQDETTGPSVYPEDATSTKIDEYQVGSNSEQSHVALAGPNPEHMHDNPPSSSRTLSSMKNLEDNFTFGDQVINDKSQEDELGKTTVESEVESMVIVPIQQASSFARPLNTHVIDLSSPKLKDYEILLQQVFNEYFNPPPRAVSLDPVSIVASRAIDPVGSPSSTTIDQDEHLLVLHQQIKKFNLKSLIKVLKNKFMDIKMHN
ncbi:hypothetical protein Tco_0250484 [Tanacetum coccineum]